MRYLADNPQSIFSLLGTAFVSYFKILKKIILVFFIAYGTIYMVPLVIAFLTGYITAAMSNVGPPSERVIIIINITSLIVSTLIGFFAYLSVLIRSSGVLAGVPITIKESFNVALNRLMPMLGLFLITLAIFGVLLFGGRGLASLFDSKVPKLIIEEVFRAGGFIFVLYAVFTTFLIVIDKLGLIEALRISMHLVYKQWLRTLCAIIVMTIVVLLAFAIMGIIVGFLPTEFTITFNAMRPIMQLFLLTISLGFWLLFLNDLKIRKQSL